MLRHLLSSFTKIQGILFQRRTLSSTHLIWSFVPPKYASTVIQQLPIIVRTATIHQYIRLHSNNNNQDGDQEEEAQYHQPHSPNPARQVERDALLEIILEPCSGHLAGGSAHTHTHTHTHTHARASASARTQARTRMPASAYTRVQPNKIIHQHMHNPHMNTRIQSM